MPRLYTVTKSVRQFFETKPPAKRVFFVFASLMIILNVAARILYPGQILGLDYNLYHPDGICYTKQAFDFAGVSSSESSQIILDKYRSLAIKYTPNIDESKCKSLEGRILYPLISSPFVMLLGMNGMLVSSVIIFLIGLFFCYLILHRYTTHSILAITLVSLVSSSSSILRWGISNTTDGLLFALSSAFFFVFLKMVEKKKKNDLYMILFVIILMLFTKRSFYIPLIYTLITLSFYFFSNIKIFANKKWYDFKQFAKNALFPFFVLLFSLILDRVLVLFTHSQNNSWIVNSVFDCLKGSNVTANPGSTFSSITCNFQDTNYFSEFLSAVFQALSNMAAYFVVTLGQIFVLDKILFIFIANYFLFLVMTLKRKKRLVDTLVSFFPISLMFVASLNSTIGLNFRLELPSIPALLLAGLFSIQFFNKRLSS